MSTITLKDGLADQVYRPESDGVIELDRHFGQDSLDNWSTRKITLKLAQGILPSDVWFETDAVYGLQGPGSGATYLKLASLLHVKGQSDSFSADFWGPWDSTDHDQLSDHYGLDTIEFADGTVWSKRDILQQLTIVENCRWYVPGLPGSDLLIGDGRDLTFNAGSGDDTLVSSAGNELLQGGLGSDTYRFGTGWGHDSIKGDADGQTVIEFGAGVLGSGLQLERHVDDLYVSDGQGNDLVMNRAFVSNDADIPKTLNIQFADGTRWTMADILRRAHRVGNAYDSSVKGSVRSEFIDGRGGDDDLVSGGGSDTLIGGAGNDTIDVSLAFGRVIGLTSTLQFEPGFGHDEVLGYDAKAQSLLLDFQGGLRSTDVSIHRLSLGGNVTNDALVVVKATQDSVRIANYFVPGSGNVVGHSTGATLKFSDGVQMDLAQTLGRLDATLTSDQYLVIKGTASPTTTQAGPVQAIEDPVTSSVGRNIVGTKFADSLVGAAGDDTLVGGWGNDRITGGGGQDCVVFNLGDGHDVLSGDIAVLQIGSGLNAADARYDLGGLGTGMAILSFAGLADAIDFKPGTLGSVEFSDGTSWHLSDLQALNKNTARFTPSELWPAIAPLQASEGAAVVLLANPPSKSDVPGDRKLLGSDGADKFTSGGPYVELVGGAGDDVYVLDEWSTNTIKELPGQGRDSVFSSGDIHLPDNVEDLPGLGNKKSGWGNDLDNVLAGSGGNHLFGEGGSDTLSGYIGYSSGQADTLAGGVGDDVYLLTPRKIYVNSQFMWRLPEIKESKDEGVDEVRVLPAQDDDPYSYVLPDNIENYRPGSYGLEYAQIYSLTGNGLDNSIRGGQESNLISGEAGADTLWGFEGNDTLQGGEGNDVLMGGSGDDSLSGDAGDDVLNGGDGSNRLRGGLGNDTIVASGDGSLIDFDRNDGRDVITNMGLADVVIFGEGVSAKDVLMSYQPASASGGLATLKLIMQGGTGADELTIQGESSWDDLRNIQAKFADGSTYAAWQFEPIPPPNQTLIGTSGGDKLTGGAGNDTLTGLAGNDMLEGETGADVYAFAKGDGQDVVHADSQDTIAFDTSLARGDLIIGKLGATAANTVVLGFKNNTDSITLDNAGQWNGLKLSFADGSSLTGADIMAEATKPVEPPKPPNVTLTGTAGKDKLTGGAGNDTLTGLAGNDTLAGGLGADKLIGGKGNDTYLFNRGDGKDTIVDTDSTWFNADLLKVGSAKSNQLWLTKSGNNLDIGIIGTQDHVVIQDWYLSSNNRVEKITALGDNKSLSASKVNALVTAMAKFAAPTDGVTTLPASTPTALTKILASSWA
jgi:Ca2+-binding RTX toxin-like protein